MTWQSELDELAKREALAKGMGGEDKIKRQHEAGRLTIQEFESLCPGVSRRTLQRDIRVLLDKRLLTEGGSSPTDPTRHYRLSDSHRLPRG